MATEGPVRGSAIGGWLGGPGAAPDGSMPSGPRIQLPATGPGSAVGTGRKLGGIVLDLVAAGLIGRAIVLTGHHGLNAVTGAQTLAFLLEVWLLQATTGQSLGQRATRTRLVSVGGGVPASRWVFLRTFLLIFPPFLLGLITDADGRGLHDKAAGTIVVSAE